MPRQAWFGKAKREHEAFVHVAVTSATTAVPEVVAPCQRSWHDALYAFVLHIGVNPHNNVLNMQQPVLVRSYTGRRTTDAKSRGAIAPTLPAISSYAFADIVRSADGPDFQSAIDGIAEICAKNRLSLAEEYASHLPPVGEITEASSRRVGPQLRKPGLRRALTSVPEGSSGSSEGSHRSKRRSIFAFRSRQEDKLTAPRRIRIGSMGRSLTVTGTTAIASDLEQTACSTAVVQSSVTVRPIARRSSSAAATSLQRLLSFSAHTPD